MTFADLPAGESIFLDANTLIYHFVNDSKYGPACTQLMKRVELRQVSGYASAHVVSDVAHRLITLEAMNKLAWPLAGIAARLRKHHVQIASLSVFRQAIVEIPLLGIQVLPVSYPTIEAATLLSRQHELLTGDASIVAIMQLHGLVHIASNDDDFDRVSGIIRYAPV